MTPVEKIQKEEIPNRSIMILRPEGVFYRAYERSAYLVCKTVKEFKTTKRFYKNVGCEIVSIGFPKDTYEKYFADRAASVDIDGTIRVHSGIELDAELFESWKQSLPLTTAKDIRRPIEGDRIQVYHDSYALLIQLSGAIVNIQKDYKKILGEDLMRKSIDLVRSVLKANDSTDNDGRIAEICRGQMFVDDINLLLRILCDLHQISVERYMMLSRMSVSISGQLKAWKSYIENKQSQKRQGILQTEG